MQTYETGYLTASQSGPLVVVTLIAASRPFSLLEFGVSVSTASVASVMQFGVPAAAGTGSAGTALEPADPSDPAASAAIVVGAFATTQPTAPSSPVRQLRLPTPNAAGPGRAWGWEPGELIVPAGGQIVLWQSAGTGSFSGYAKVAEGG